MVCHKKTPQSCFQLDEAKGIKFGRFEPYFKIHLLYERKILHFELPKQVFYYFASKTKNSENLYKKELTADDADFADLTLIFSISISLCDSTITVKREISVKSAKSASSAVRKI
jgi:hypothetical protein